MICPTCHGNGYWVEKLRVMRQVRQCDRCRSQGEIKELKNAKINED
jgi:DnaJ-class molecular chaperone